jgi:hypothetical protein
MGRRARYTATLAASVAAWGLTAALGAQGPGKPAAGDGLLASELALAGRSLTVAYAPDLKADAPAHQPFQIDSAPASGARIRLLRLVATGPVLLDGLEIGKAGGRPSPAGVRHDAWLLATGDGWSLEVTEVPKDPPVNATVIGRVALSRTAAPAAAPTLVAALIPESGDSGRLLLRWGRHEASAGVTFNRQMGRPPRPESQPNQLTSRKHHEDLSLLTRMVMLTQRNETAIEVIRDRRISVTFQRTFVPGEFIVNTAATETTRGLPADGPDFARLLSTPDGSVVQLTRASVPRLKTETALRFGKTVIATGNQVPGVPGMYGLWLKRQGQGWRLVFNHEPDVWGTQHDARRDAAEIELEHSQIGAPSRPFTVALVPAAADRGRLVIAWGPHEWRTDFIVQN